VEPSTFDLVAASLRADSNDIKSFVEALATKLSVTFPGLVQVDRARGLGRGPKPVRRIVVSLGDDRYELDSSDGAVVCTRSAMVRGIALRNEQLALEVWIDSLSHSLLEQAELTEQGRAALARLIT